MKNFFKILLLFLILFCAADTAMPAKKAKTPKKAAPAKKQVKTEPVKPVKEINNINNIDLSALNEKERLGLSLQTELSRSGTSNNDPVEREAALREIIERCSGTEEAENAYWSLADLYLDAFSEPKEKEACEILERFIKNYPDSRWLTQVKCRLFVLYDGKGERAAELYKELQKSGDLPNIIKSNLRAYVK